MKTTFGKRTRGIAWLFMLIYFGSYLLRIHFTVMLVRICSDLQVEKSTISIVITALTITYGLGQVINGWIGDKINSQRMLSAGLILAILCNIAMFFSHTIPVMTVIWGINGFAHSMLWPPMVRLMSLYLDDHEYSYAAVRVSWGSCFATILLYSVCPLLLSVTGWRNIILLCAFLGCGILITWLILAPKLFCDPPALGNRTESAAGAVLEPRKLPRFTYPALLLIILGIIFQGMLRDGVTNWMPSFLLETFGLSEEYSIFSTVILAIFSVISFAVFDLVHRKIFRNEVFCSAMIFGFSLISAVLLFLVHSLSSPVVLSMLLMALIVGSMHGINLMLLSIVPKRLIKSGRISTFSGILNAGTYIGSALASYGFAALAEQKGWGFTLFSWILVSAGGLAVCLIAAPLWKRFRREYSDCDDESPQTLS
ncbi:MAG: MFS transporter [Clostridia bacterium]|nr:MFS transporter [Clostridia bacterium]